MLQCTISLVLGHQICLHFSTHGKNSRVQYIQDVGKFSINKNSSIFSYRKLRSKNKTKTKKFKIQMKNFNGKIQKESWLSRMLHDINLNE